MIKTADIIPNPYQTRRKFEKGELEALAASIKEVGMLSPVILRRSTCGYEVICGQRRLRAATIAGMSEIPAIIVRAGDAQCAELSIIENIHRRQLSVFEEAEGYYNLMIYHRIKKDKLLRALSADSFAFNEKVRLLSLCEKARYKTEEGNIEERYIKELLKLRNEEKQVELAEKIVKEDLSYKEVCREVREMLKEMAQNTAGRERNTRRAKSLKERMPLYINTVKETVDLLKKNGAKVEFTQNENEEYVEFSIKTLK